MLFLALVFTAWQAWHVRGALQESAAELTSMTTAVAEGDVPRAEWQLSEAADSAATAHRHTRGPVWWAASKLPGIGDDVTAVRTVAEVTDDLTHDTLPSMVAVGARLTSDDVARDGQVRLAPITEAAPVLQRGSGDLAAASGRVDELETRGLVDVLRPQVLDLRSKLGRATKATRAAATAADLLPPMLGGQGKRTYLLIFQNNAEVRATGGLPGAFAIVTAENGRIDLQRTAAPRDIGYFEQPFRAMPANMEDLFSNRAVQYPADIGINPDFPWGAETLSGMWTARQGGEIDGVMAIDPVSLSYALEATGPLNVLGRQLTGATAVDVLLRDVYLEVADDEAQNQFYASVTSQLFAKVARGDFDPARLVTAVARGVSEHRVLLWADRAAEQKQLAPLTIAGAVPTEKDRSPQVGVYLNDSGADKLTYYLDHRVDVTPRSCGGTGQQVLDVKVTLTSSVPVDRELPPSVVGPGTPGVPLGDMLITTYLYAPVEGRIDELTVDGEETAWFEGSHLDREVGALTLSIPRSEKRVMTYTVYTGRDQTGKADVLTTPGVRDSGVGRIGASVC